MQVERGVLLVSALKQEIKLQIKFINVHFGVFESNVEVLVPHCGQHSHYESVWGKQTPGWRLSALTGLPVKFLSWLPTLACHSSSERRENECRGVGHSERYRVSIQLIFLWLKKGEGNRKLWQMFSGRIPKIFFSLYLFQFTGLITWTQRERERQQGGLLWVRGVGELFEALKECNRVGPIL